MLIGPAVDAAGATSERATRMPVVMAVPDAQTVAPAAIDTQTAGVEIPSLYPDPGVRSAGCHR